MGYGHWAGDLGHFDNGVLWPCVWVDSLHLILYYSSTSGRLISIYVLADA
jgi:hypothetical protein